MPPSVRRVSKGVRRKIRRPDRAKCSTERFFYPAEVARILDVELDYRQLRKLHRIVSLDRRKISNQKWARFTFRDLVALRVALQIGRQTRQSRLNYRLIERVVLVLKERDRIGDPLLTVPLTRSGRVVIAHMEGASKDAVNGQRLIPGLLEAVRSNVNLTGSDEIQHIQTAAKNLLKRAGNEIRLRVIQTA